VLNSARSLNEVYQSKNRFFEKDPVSQILFGSLFGSSIVLAQGDDLWSKKRKVLSSAFYKEKLVKMTDVIRQIVAGKIGEIERDFVDTRQSIDIIKEMADLQMRVIFIAAFGLHDLHLVKLPYLQNGETKNITIGDFLR
jgi:cytochrome P450